jgi:YD repeat-containing protein
MVTLQLSVFVRAGYRIEYEYDSLDRLIKVTHPNNKTVNYIYDAVGNRTYKVIVKGPLNPDINHSGRVDFIDFAILAQDWLKFGEYLPGDINKDGIVDIEDLAVMADYWLTSGKPQPPNPDINHSGIVNFADFAILAEEWFLSGSCLLGDLNRDGIVDTKDLAIMADYWLKPGEPL